MQGSVWWGRVWEGILGEGMLKGEWCVFIRDQGGVGWGEGVSGVKGGDQC